MYKVVITERAIRDIEKLDLQIRKRIGEKLEDFSKDPFRYAVKLVNPKIGSFRFRIGEHRVIFDIEDNKIVILRVGNRREIYK